MTYYVDCYIGWYGDEVVVEANEFDDLKHARDFFDTVKDEIANQQEDRAVVLLTSGGKTLDGFGMKGHNQ